MDQAIRNKLRSVVTQCRKLLEDSVRDELQGKYGVYAALKDDVKVDDDARMTHLSDEERAARKDILDHFDHIKARGFKPNESLDEIKARGFKPKESLDQLVREVAFTHLNRFCAYKMMEARQVHIGDQRFREAVSRGVNSNGVKFYLADHLDDERLFTTGQQDVAYRHFLDWLGGLLSDEIGVLFSPHDPANRLYPPQRVLDEVLALINDEALAEIWTQDETIGWVYQYFTPKELRDQARKESQAPRNSYELAFRNQFFTPRYVVEFLTDNTLGRIWYEMRKGDTKLKEQCRYLVRRPSEVFLGDPLAAAEQLGFKVEEGKELPPSVQAAFRGDFASAIDEKDGLFRSWIGLVVPHDQYEAASGYPLRENETHPSVDEVWSALIDHPDGRLPLHPLKIVVALSQLVLTASGGPYAAKATDQLWGALAATVKAQTEQSDLSQDQLLKLPVCVPHRAKKDPRELKILDPASGSGHFLLYCFDLLLLIYEEAYTDPDLGPALQRDYPTLDALQRDVPRLILAHNLHGIDIDLRASQIAALALWLRCQRAYQDMGLRKDRPKITRSNFVCAEPMPGEGHMLKEFVKQIEPRLLGQLVEVVFDKMKLAGEAGSLLRIEEDIRDAVAEARRQWVTGPVLIQRSLFDDDKPIMRQQRFDFSGVTDTQFFEQAETKVVEALRNYAEKAQNGQRLQRRLFTEDAVRGFAFVDLCHKRFDVVLMNPPFGVCSVNIEQYMRGEWGALANDIYVLFIAVNSERLARMGLLGAITSRGFMVGRDQRAFRPLLLGNGPSHLETLLDLGLDVLDAAAVETCAYVLIRDSAHSPSRIARFFDCRAVARSSIDQLLDVLPDQPTYCHALVRFRRHRDCDLIYAATNDEMASLSSDAAIDPSFGKVTKGLNSSDDDRFIRLMWEVDSGTIKDRWQFCAKGAEYQWFVTNITTVIDWGDNGRQIREHTASVSDNVAQAYRSSKYYYKTALTYTYRCSDFSLRALPKGCLFTNAAPVIVCKDGGTAELRYIGLLSAFLSERYARLLAHISKKGKYETGPVGKLPLPPPPNHADLAIAWDELAAIILSFESSLETSPYFVSHSLFNPLVISREEIASRIRTFGNCSGMKPSEEFIDRAARGFVERYEKNNSWPHAVLSYLFGVSVGRWDIRLSSSEKPRPLEVTPFTPLPRIPPGTLERGCHTAVSNVPSDYPVHLSADGILVDDPDHAADIVRCIQKGFEYIWPNLTTENEMRLCRLLEVESIRDYLRKSTGFWNEHIKRYTSCLRRAPIYWLLQSSKKNYAIWLYYHRLDKDLLFKVLLNYVEPKIRLEESQLEALRTQKAAAGDSGREAKRLGKDVERKDEFISELKDFEDKLRRVAGLHLEPDLNDGVVLNIAPLHELVPWNEAKSYWQELLDGKYEWSTIGKQLREKGLVK